jgi:uncharacterized membrane protein YbhN (UPF0104 family)
MIVCLNMGVFTLIKTLTAVVNSTVHGFILKSSPNTFVESFSFDLLDQREPIQQLSILHKLIKIRHRPTLLLNGFKIKLYVDLVGRVHRRNFHFSDKHKLMYLRLGFGAGRVTILSLILILTDFIQLYTTLCFCRRFSVSPLSYIYIYIYTFVNLVFNAIGFQFTFLTLLLYYSVVAEISIDVSLT